MDALHGRLRMMCGASLLALAGCYSYPSYSPSPYGPTMAPPVYGAPPATLGPATPVIPQETYPQGVVPQQGALSPSGTQIGSQPYSRTAPRYDESAPNWQQPTPPDSDAPPFQGNGTSTQRKPDGNLVPEYDDPTSQTVPQRSRTGQSYDSGPVDNEMFDNPGKSPFSLDDGMGSSDSQTSGAPGPVLASGEDADLQRSPSIQTSFSTAVEQEDEPNAVPLEPNPFEHDQQGFRWLRGVVDYDTDEKLWHILYDLTPTDEDELGGEIALVGEQRLLNSLKTRDVVLVEGRIDEARTDRFGKPCYRVDRLQRLQPQAPSAGEPSSTAGKQGLGVSPWAEETTTGATP